MLPPLFCTPWLARFHLMKLAVSVRYRIQISIMLGIPLRMCCIFHGEIAPLNQRWDDSGTFDSNSTDYSLIPIPIPSSLERHQEIETAPFQFRFRNRNCPITALNISYPVAPKFEHILFLLFLEDLVVLEWELDLDAHLNLDLKADSSFYQPRRLTRQGDNALGSVCPSASPSVRLSALSHLNPHHQFNPFSAELCVVNCLCGWQGVNEVFSCTTYANITSNTWASFPENTKV